MGRRQDAGRTILQRIRVSRPPDFSNVHLFGSRLRQRRSRSVPVAGHRHATLVVERGGLDLSCFKGKTAFIPSTALSSWIFYGRGGGDEIYLLVRAKLYTELYTGGF